MRLDKCLAGRSTHAATRLGAAERPDNGHGGGDLVHHHRVEAPRRDEQHEGEADAAQEGTHRVQPPKHGARQPGGVDVDPRRTLAVWSCVSGRVAV